MRGVALLGSARKGRARNPLRAARGSSNLGISTLFRQAHPPSCRLNKSTVTVRFFAARWNGWSSVPYRPLISIAPPKPRRSTSILGIEVLRRGSGEAMVCLRAWPAFFTLMSRRDSSVRSALFVARPPRKVILQLRRSGMDSSDEGVVKRHAAPNGAWLPGRNVAIDMALLTELARRVQCACKAAVASVAMQLGRERGRAPPWGHRSSRQCAGRSESRWPARTSARRIGGRKAR